MTLYDPLFKSTAKTEKRKIKETALAPYYFDSQKNALQPAVITTNGKEIQVLVDRSARVCLPMKE